MPRSGGDYVFTSRIIGPLWGWIESWTLVGSALTILGFEIIVATHNIQLTAILLGTAFPGSSFGGAVNWFQDDLSKIITGIIIMLIITGVSLLRTRTFHRVVSALTVFAIVSVAISFVGAFAIDPGAVSATLSALGTSAQSILSSAGKAGWSPGAPDFSLSGLVALGGLAGVILFQFSSYIAGEVKGNVRRTVLVAVIGALIFAVFVNSHLRSETGGLFHLDSTATQRPVAGALLWLRCPMHQGPVTRCPLSSSLAEGRAFAWE